MRRFFHPGGNEFCVRRFCHFASARQWDFRHRVGGFFVSGAEDFVLGSRLDLRQGMLPLFVSESAGFSSLARRVFCQGVFLLVGAGQGERQARHFWQDGHGVFGRGGSLDLSDSKRRAAVTKFSAIRLFDGK